jgi:lipopolysaccharide heptosyltransferase I
MSADVVTQPRILIVRLSAIGDALHGLPVLVALRDAFPQAFLAWAIEGRAASLLEGHPALDELIALPRRWLKSPRTVLNLRRRLKAFRFDVTIDVQGLSKSAIAARLSGAPRRIGFAGAEGREISRWLNNELVLPTKTHVVDRNLELLGPLGVHNPQVRFELHDAPADAQTAEHIVANLGLERFAIINPGAGWPSKLWPTDRYAAVTRHLSAKHELPSLVVWANPAERQMAEQIVACSGGRAVLAPDTTLGQLAALARRAELFVGSDTGPLHLAGAVGTCCVGLYGPSPLDRNGPYGPQHVGLQKIRLPGSSRERRQAGPESMQAISIADVCEACEQVLARRRPARLSA